MHVHVVQAVAVPLSSRWVLGVGLAFPFYLSQRANHGRTAPVRPIIVNLPSQSQHSHRPFWEQARTFDATRIFLIHAHITNPPRHSAAYDIAIVGQETFTELTFSKLVDFLRNVG
jgi:hypothetical protein